ncbi:MAG TPA: M28 family peptidase [Gemmatimonadaceae bacterium]|nr:M28 family peptidase [Gemmatimonadaceae bacterium]
MRTFRSIFALSAAALLAVACRGDKGQTSFNGTAALAYAKAQLDFGTRVPNSLGAQRAGDWIVAQMKTRADTVIEQKWDHVTVKGDTLHLRNILARIHPAAAQRVLFLTHWDTRPVSDQARDPAQRNAPMPGANDGASGVALLVALGDALKKTPANVGVDLLFVDGEDYGDFGAMKDVLLGSTYFASHLPSPDYKPLYAVLFDMIGDKDLDIYQEPISLSRAPEVVSLVWNEAQSLGYARYFINSPSNAGVTDDHVPLLDAGIHTIDVIDFDYPSHHTPDDTFDKLSAHSLQVVGDVATGLLTSK